MANETASKTIDATPAMTPLSAGALALGWFIPGAGHLMLKRWGRGLLLMASISVMFFIGIAMQGKIYTINTGDLLDMLGFVGDIGSGALYLFAQLRDLGQGTIYRATADYGTKFVIVAGLLNVIAAIDAYHIALGKKQ